MWLKEGRFLAGAEAYASIRAVTTSRGIAWQTSGAEYSGMGTELLNIPQF